MPSLISNGVSKCGGGNYDDAKLSGVVTVQGSVNCNKFHSEGVCTINGSLDAKDIDISGVCKINDYVKSDSFNLYGTTTIKGDLQSEIIDINGSFNINGSINADKINIVISYKSDVKSCFGESISVKRGKTSNIFDVIINKKNEFNAQTLECDNIYLEHSNVQSVYGNKIKIGPKCNIKYLEYSESYEIDHSSMVSKVVKRGEQGAK